MTPREHGRSPGPKAWRALGAAGIAALVFLSCSGPQVTEPDYNGVVWTRLTPSSVDDCIWPDAADDSLIFSSRILVPVFDQNNNIISYAFHHRNTVSASDGASPFVINYLGAAYWNDLRPRWAGNQRIVFMDNRPGPGGGTYDIYYKDLDTFDEYRLLTTTGTDETAPVPRPGTAGLAYVELLPGSARPYGPGRLVLIPDTAAVPLERIYLTPDTLRCMDPDWDPTGTKLCFSVENAADLTRHVYTMNLAPGDSLPVQRTTGLSHDFHPRWSPDGGRIVFVSDRTSRSGVWVVHPEGEGQGLKLVSFDDANAASFTPAWTEDGTGIIVSSNGRGGQRALWLLTNLPDFGF
ncbi:MAG TPA: hypothetical protein VFM17_02000 [Candidatus Eisenbacteria bacterium]|nr:hypothetical protein [Candidatus Eisenbacteria bacterium]